MFKKGDTVRIIAIEFKPYFNIKRLFTVITEDYYNDGSGFLEISNDYEKGIVHSNFLGKVIEDKFQVKLVTFNDLTEEEKEMQPNNGCGKEEANYIKVMNAGQTVFILSDAVEKKNANFLRGFHNVIKAIEKAYEIGKDNGKDELLDFLDS